MGNSLEDYISTEEKKIIEEESRKNRPIWAKFYPNIDYYQLPEDKLELIYEFINYINEYNFNTPSSKENKYGNYFLMQAQSTDNRNIAIMIENREASFIPTVYFSENRKKYIKEDDYIETPNKYIRFISGENKLISEEELDKRINKYIPSGFQDFYALDLTGLDKYYHGDGFAVTRRYYAYYSEDGRIFMSGDLADNIINKVTTEELGEHLAREAVKLKNKVYKK